MKFLFKKVFLCFLCFLLGLLVSMLSFANTKVVTTHEHKKKPDTLQYPFPNEAKEKTELKARGVIIKFQRWPNSTEQKKIIRKLQASDLKKTKSIRNFKIWLFEWSEEGLKPSRFGERACKTLKGLFSIKRCNPDHLLSLNRQKNKGLLELKKFGKLFDNFDLSVMLAEVSQETEAGFVEHCTSCSKQNSISPIPLNIRTCNLISHEQKLIDGKLSDYWAQELIGSDLLREELEKTPPPKIPNWIAIFDSQEDDHNVHVRNLIVDNKLHAILPEIVDKKIPFFRTEEPKEYKNVLSVFETGFPGDYISEADYLRKAPPHFINNSMSWGGSEDIYEVFQELSPPSIVVIASGNTSHYNKLLEDVQIENVQSKASKNFDAILVGNFSPNGFVSGDSISGEEVHIMAPSGNWLTSAGKNGEYKKFSGTSGASALVTGSLAGFEWLSNYHPTPEEARILLEKTAIPTLHSHEEPQVNGVGLVNAYKLGEVGKRLKEKCKKSISCFREEILNEKHYHFDIDNSLTEDVKRSFPSCAMDKKSVNSDMSNCEEKEKVFKKLRKAVLLNPEESKDFLKSLSCIYREGGFSQNAEVMDKLGLAIGSKEEVRDSVRDLARKERPISDELLRLMMGMGGFEDEFNLYKQRWWFTLIPMIGVPAAFSFLEKAFDTGEFDLQIASVKRASILGETGLPLMEKAYNTNNLDLQLLAVATVGHPEMGDSGFPLIEKAYNADNPKLQIRAVRMAGVIGERGLPLVNKAYNTNNLDLQQEAVLSAGRLRTRTTGKIREQALYIIKHAFNTGNLILQERAVMAADYPMLVQMSKRKDLDQSIKEKIYEQIDFFKEHGFVKE